MTPTQESIHLGLEELALAMSFIGRPEVAKSLLYMVYGALAEDDERGRLLAAGHSLIARDLLVIRDDQPLLVDSFQPLVQALVDPDFIVQYTREIGDADESLAYFVKGATIVEQQVSQGVHYTLTRAADRTDISAGGLRIFAIPPGAAPGYPEVEVPVAVLDQAKAAATQPPAAIATLLHQAGLPDPLAEILAEDFHAPSYRGAAIRVESKEGVVRSDRGFLLLKGALRVWLFLLSERAGVPYARIVPATPGSFARAIHGLLA